jgi:hypothetical protein
MKTLGTGLPSPRGLHEGGQEGGLLYWGPRKMLTKALEMASLSTRTLLWGNMEGRPFLRAFEEKKNSYQEKYD